MTTALEPKWQWATWRSGPLADAGRAQEPLSDGSLAVDAGVADNADDGTRICTVRVRLRVCNDRLGRVRPQRWGAVTCMSTTAAGSRTAAAAAAAATAGSRTTEAAGARTTEAAGSRTTTVARSTVAKWESRMTASAPGSAACPDWFTVWTARVANQPDTPGADSSNLVGRNNVEFTLF